MKKLIVPVLGDADVQPIVELLASIGVESVHTMEEDAAGIVLLCAADAEVPEELMSSVLPMLGIDGGMLLLCEQFEGRVDAAATPETGLMSAKYTKHPLTKDLSGPVYMDHDRRVWDLPDDFEAVACTPLCPVAAMAGEEEKIYGVQFLPHKSECGAQLLKNFAFDICGC